MIGQTPTFPARLKPSPNLFQDRLSTQTSLNSIHLFSKSSNRLHRHHHSRSSSQESSHQNRNALNFLSKLKIERKKHNTEINTIPEKERREKKKKNDEKNEVEISCVFRQFADFSKMSYRNGILVTIRFIRF